MSNQSTIIINDVILKKLEQDNQLRAHIPQDIPPDFRVTDLVSPSGKVFFVDICSAFDECPDAGVITISNENIKTIKDRQKLISDLGLLSISDLPGASCEADFQADDRYPISQIKTIITSGGIRPVGLAGDIYVDFHRLNNEDINRVHDAKELLGYADILSDQRTFIVTDKLSYSMMNLDEWLAEESESPRPS